MRRSLQNAMMAVGAFLLVAGALGCVNLKQKYVAVVGYALEAGKPETTAAQARKEIVIKVRPLRIAPMFEGRKLIYKMNGNTWSSDYYHEFFVEPAPMFTGLVHDWLTATGRWEVVQGSSFVPGTHYVEGTILELYGDYTGEGAPVGVLSLDLLAMEDRRGGPPRVVLHKKYRETAALTGSGPPELVAGWNTALRNVLLAFERDLAAALAQP